MTDSIQLCQLADMEIHQSPSYSALSRVRRHLLPLLALGPTTYDLRLTNYDLQRHRRSVYTIISYISLIFLFKHLHQSNHLPVILSNYPVFSIAV